MHTKHNILFIINPISGGKGKLRIPDFIDKYLDKEKFNANFVFTEYIGHAAELADEAANKNFDILIAAGGDGTINEVATKVLQHQKILGILPLGSGNGLARFLQIPKNLRQAILAINRLKIDKIDTATFNNKKFFNLAGIGFDAHLSSVFSNDKKRGLAGYVKLGLKEVFGYRAQKYIIDIDGIEYQRNAFAISIANSSQYGNDVFIAPGASIRDGLLDVCIIKPFSLLKLPLLGYVMLKGTAEHSEMIEIIKGKQIKILRETDGAVHIDGEPLKMGKEIAVSVAPLSLSVVVP
ncbi:MULTISPECIES: diacylglycerol kinase family protein [unclassified Pedobacter]|uniref:diacylglycerol/lipid kinase family protein n=1 Tax=Pedobacter TaxID=84567 RepID=UPI00209C57F5|nr:MULTISPECIES: diacylglycerol kinase family protein [unclassified Pedobacter]MCX2431895.1 diacylglycerol kinase family lipid kinase [Pedobacter sp. GR22-10]